MITTRSMFKKIYRARYGRPPVGLTWQELWLAWSNQKFSFALWFWEVK